MDTLVLRQLAGAQEPLRCTHRRAPASPPPESALDALLEAVASFGPSSSCSEIRSPDSTPDALLEAVASFGPSSSCRVTRLKATPTGARWIACFRHFFGGGGLPRPPLCPRFRHGSVRIGRRSLALCAASVATRPLCSHRGVWRNRRYRQEWIDISIPDPYAYS